MDRDSHGLPWDVRIRLATLADIPALNQLIIRSARELSARDYSPEQIAGALQGVFGVDTQLIHDQTYFVADLEQQLVGCGGWSRRATLFGADAIAGRDPEPLDPRADAARIRAFFVRPGYGRRGIARALLLRCEEEASKAGFRSLELMATLTGVPFYTAHGYASGPELEQPLATGGIMRLVSMRKELV